MKPCISNKKFIYIKEVITHMIKQSNHLTNGFVVCILASFCCMLWGSAFPGIKLGYSFFAIPSNALGSQLLFAGMRFTLAGILTILFGSIFSKKCLRPKKENWKNIFILCLVQTVAQYVFFYIGMSHTTGVKGSIITASNVFLALLIPALLFKPEPLSFMKILGCLIGFSGVVLINLNGSSIDFSMTWNGEGFIFLSALSYAFSSVLIKGYSKKENPVVLSGYQFFLGGIILMAIGLLFGGKITTVNTSAILSLLHLALVSSVAYTIWAILLKHNPVGKVAVYGFMNPICGVILSTLLLHENNQAFGLTGILSLFLVCVGIFIVNRGN